MESATCLGFVVGTFGGVTDNCALCTSCETHTDPPGWGGAWATWYERPIASKARTWCTGNWNSDWNNRLSPRSVTQCQQSCLESATCLGFVVGTYGGVKDNCALCTSSETHTDPPGWGGA